MLTFGVVSPAVGPVSTPFLACTRRWPSRSNGRPSLKSVTDTKVQIANVQIPEWCRVLLEGAGWGEGVNLALGDTMSLDEHRFQVARIQYWPQDGPFPLAFLLGRKKLGTRSTSRAGSSRLCSCSCPVPVRLSVGWWFWNAPKSGWDGPLTWSLFGRETLLFSPSLCRQGYV